MVGQSLGDTVGIAVRQGCNEAVVIGGVEQVVAHTLSCGHGVDTDDLTLNAHNGLNSLGVGDVEAEARGDTSLFMR